MQKYILLVCTCLMSLVASGQYVTFKTLEKEASIAEAKKDYNMAYGYYRQMIEFDRNPVLYHYKCARMALDMKAYKTADEHLAHVDSLTIESEDEENSFADLNFYRGVAAHHTGKYDQAIVYYNLFLSEAKEGDERIEEAQKRIEHVDWANYQKADTLVTIQHLGESINSPYSDFGATELDDSRILFSTDRALIKRDRYPTPRKISHIYYSENDDDASILGGDINTDDSHSSNTTFSPDGKKLYYTICEFKENSTEIRCDIYERSFNPDSLYYGPAKLVEGEINYPGYTTTQPHCAELPDGQVALFFASDRPGGAGKTDLYYSLWDTTNNQWGSVVSLDSLNTAEEEWSPSFSTIDGQLYFSSNGLLGFGSLDVYRADWNGAMTQSPSNLGAPINSSYDDVYYTLSPDGNQGYMASNRDGSYFLDSELEACCFDLYKVYHIPPPIELLVRVFDEYDTTEILESSVRLLDVETGELLGPITSANWDDYSFKISHHKPYQLIAQKAGYLPDTLDFDTEDERGVEILEKTLYLKKQVPLAVTVWDENTGEPLPGALVKLFDTTDSIPKLLEETTNPNGHDYAFTLIRGRSYELFGTKRPLYDTATVPVASIETALGEPIEKEIDLVQLAIRRLERVFPLVLYFDNDQPNPGTKKRTTDLTYNQTYEEYMERKPEFIKQYTAKLGGSEYGQQADREIKAFFEDEVEHGYGKLNYFMEQLHGVLQGGLLVEVSIKGYTSPIAKGDYNLRLGQRRVQCLKNEFLSWNNGILMTYVDIGKLVLKEISFGETKAPVGLSDNPLDKRNSVYSPLASKERRVEVIAVRRMAKRANSNEN